MRRKYEESKNYKDSVTVKSELEEIFINSDKETIELSNSVMIRTFFIKEEIEAVSISLRGNKYFVTVKTNGDEWWLDENGSESYEIRFDDIILDDRMKLVSKLKDGIHI